MSAGGGRVQKHAPPSLRAQQAAASVPGRVPPPTRKCSSSSLPAGALSGANQIGLEGAALEPFPS